MEAWSVIFSLAAFAWIIAFGCLGAWVARQCGRDTAEGGILGALFGPLGVLIEALLPRPQKRPPMPQRFVESHELPEMQNDDEIQHWLSR